MVQSGEAAGTVAFDGASRRSASGRGAGDARRMRGSVGLQGDTACTRASQARRLGDTHVLDDASALQVWRRAWPQVEDDAGSFAASSSAATSARPASETSASAQRVDVDVGLGRAAQPGVLVLRSVRQGQPADRAFEDRAPCSSGRRPELRRTRRRSARRRSSSRRSRSEGGVVSSARAATVRRRGCSICDRGQAARSCLGDLRSSECGRSRRTTPRLSDRAELAGRERGCAARAAQRTSPREPGDAARAGGFEREPARKPVGFVAGAVEAVGARCVHARPTAAAELRAEPTPASDLRSSRTRCSRWSSTSADRDGELGVDSSDHSCAHPRSESDVLRRQKVCRDCADCRPRATPRPSAGQASPRPFARRPPAEK